MGVGQIRPIVKYRPAAEKHSLPIDGDWLTRKT